MPADGILPQVPIANFIMTNDPRERFNHYDKDMNGNITFNEFAYANWQQDNGSAKIAMGMKICSLFVCLSSVVTNDILLLFAN